MAHTANAALSGATTLSQTEVERDANSVLANGGAITRTSKRTGSRLSSAKLEFNTTRMVRSYYSGFKYSGGGDRQSVIVVADPAPQLHIAGAFAADVAQETQNFVAVIDEIPVPLWTHADAATPKCRLEALAVTCTIIITTDTLTEDGGALQFNDDQAVADALTVRVYRIPSTRLRPLNTSSGSSDILGHEITPGMDASLVAEKTGMTARHRGPTATNNMVASAMIGGQPDPAGVAFENFQVTMLLDGAAIVPTHTLAPDDLLIVALTGTDRLIYAGNAVFKTTKRNIILPPRGVWSVPVFADVEFCV